MSPDDMAFLVDEKAWMAAWLQATAKASNGRGKQQVCSIVNVYIRVIIVTVPVIAVVTLIELVRGRGGGIQLIADPLQSVDAGTIICVKARTSLRDGTGELRGGTGEAKMVKRRRPC